MFNGGQMNNNNVQMNPGSMITSGLSILPSTIENTNRAFTATGEEKYDARQAAINQFGGTASTMLMNSGSPIGIAAGVGLQGGLMVYNAIADKKRDERMDKKNAENLYRDKEAQGRQNWATACRAGHHNSH